ncbi:sulfurtransferase complex subunit TusC [Thalassotalea sp. PLHSN55]|uniref:sulfurtransferase complex subunit TusC n=1 Tax=Thalassotalea sp. PLHSN55 TaxID=3435888 RepID=UPI003F860520
MKQLSIALLNTAAPFSTSTAKEALDVALIFGSYEQAPALFFQGDGVWQLVNNQQAESISSKDFLKTFAAFEFYDIEDIYVCKRSLEQRGLSEDFHIDNVTVLNDADFIAALNAYSTIFKF